MNQKFHKNITVAILREVGFDVKNNHFIYFFAIHADSRGKYYPNITEKHLNLSRAYRDLKLDYQDFSSLSLKNHHNTNDRECKNRIFTLIQYSKESIMKYDDTKKINYILDSIFHYCNALHFLCDAILPSTLSNSKRKELEERYLTTKLDIHWDDDKNKKFTYKQIKNMIDIFITTTLKSNKNIENVYYNKAKLYTLGLLTAKYIFTKG